LFHFLELEAVAIEDRPGWDHRQSADQKGCEQYQESVQESVRSGSDEKTDDTGCPKHDREKLNGLGLTYEVHLTLSETGEESRI